MMMAQNSMFAGQMQFSERVGVGGGLHSYGSARPPNPYEGLPHGVAPPSPFSYGPAGFSSSNYGIGNRVGAMAMSGIGAAATIGGAGLGFAGMLPRIGGALAPFVDPISAFGVGRSAAMGMGFGSAGGIAAGLGAAMIPIGLGMMGSHAIGSFVQGGQQQSLINTTLGQNFNFMNGNARTGQGFSRQDAMAIGDNIRSLAHIPEMMTSVQELTSLIPKLKASGVMSGVKDAAEFNRRFKDAVATIREVSRSIGSTLDEAAEFFAHSRRVGFLGKTDQLKNALNVQVTSSLTGMSNGQVMGLQAAGADMATQFGARRSLGTRAVTNIAQGLGVGVMAGRISEAQILDITGQEGEAGKAALAQQFAGKLANIGLSSSAGRLIMAGAAKFDENGKYTGLDSEVIRGLNNGSTSVADLKRRGMGLSRQQKLGFVSRQSDIAMDFAGSVGPGGYAGFFEGITGQRFSELGDEAATRLLEMQGFTAGESDVMRGMIGVDAQGQQQQMARLRARESKIREQYSPEAIWRRTKTKIHTALFAGLENAGAKAMDSISRTVDQAIDDIVDRHVLTLTQESSDAVAKAFSGNTRELRNMIVDATGAPTGRNSSGLGRLAAGLVTGGLTALDPTRVGGLALGGAISGAIDRGVTGFLDDRGEVGRYRQMSRLMGTSDTGSFLAAQERLNQGIDLGGIDRNTLAYARGVIGDALSGFESEDSVEGNRARLDAARGALSSAMYGSGTDAFMLRRNFEKFANRHSSGGMDPMMAFISGLQGEFKGRGTQIDFRKGTADPTEGAGYMSAAARRTAIDSATETLSGLGVGGDTIGLLRDDKKLRQILERGLSDRTTIGGKEGALQAQSPELVQQALAAQGINVTVEQAAKLKTAYSQILKASEEGDGGVIDFWRGKSDRGVRVLDAISNFKKASAAGQRDTILGQFRSSGTGLVDALSGIEGGGSIKGRLGKVGSGLMKFADEVRTKEDFDSRFGGLSDEISSVAKELAEDTSLSESDKEKLYDKAPWLRDAVSKVRQISKLKGSKFKNVEALAKSLGVTDEKGIQAVKAGLGSAGAGEIRLSESQISGLMKTLPGLAAGSSMTSVGSQNAGAERDVPSILSKIDATMKDVRKSIDLNTSTIATANGFGVEDKDTIKAMVAARNKSRENAGADPSTGSSNPGAH